MDDSEYVKCAGQMKDALRTRDSSQLRQLYGELSDLSLVRQDRRIINLAVLGYAFNKIFLKVHYKSKFEELLSRTIEHLDKGELDIILAEVKEFDRRYGFFQGDLIKKGRIKVGSRLYTGGLSLTRSADLVSVRVTDILKYSGGTQIHEDGKGAVRERLENARRFFT